MRGLRYSSRNGRARAPAQCSSSKHSSLKAVKRARKEFRVADLNVQLIADVTDDRPLSLQWHIAINWDWGCLETRRRRCRWKE